MIALAAVRGCGVRSNGKKAPAPVPWHAAGQGLRQDEGINGVGGDVKAPRSYGNEGQGHRSMIGFLPGAYLHGDVQLE